MVVQVYHSSAGEEERQIWSLQASLASLAYLMVSRPMGDAQKRKLDNTWTHEE